MPNRRTNSPVSDRNFFEIFERLSRLEEALAGFSVKGKRTVTLSEIDTAISMPVGATGAIVVSKDAPFLISYRVSGGSLTAKAINAHGPPAVPGIPGTVCNVEFWFV